MRTIVAVIIDVVCWRRQYVMRRVVLGALLAGSVAWTAARASDLENQIVDGVADFVVKRAQQEAALYLQGELAEKLCPKDGDPLLPMTCVLLQSLDQSPLALTAVARQLRSTVKRDFRELPQRKAADLLAGLGGRVEKAVESSCSEDWPGVPVEKASCINTRMGQAQSKLKAAGGALATIRVGLAIYDNSRRWTSPADWSDNLPSEDQVCNFSSGAKDTYGALKQVKAPGAQEALKEVKQGCEDTAKKFIAVVGQAKTACDDTCVANLKAYIEKIKEHRNNVLKEADLQKRRLHLEEARLARRNALRYVMNRISDKAPEGSEPGDSIRRHRRLFEAILAEDAAEIIVETLLTVRQVVKQLGDDAANDQLTSTESEALAYLAALGEIAQAESSKEVVEVIERIAAPVGSYREKLKRPMYSVTALFGLTYGSEKLDGAGGIRHEYKAAFVPIGIHGTLASSLCLFPVRRCTYGLYLSVFDLGMVVASRNSDSDGTTEKKVGLEQIFAPGLFATMHPFNAPVVFGLGASRTPALVQTPDGRSLASMRIGGFVAMDLTLFGF